MKNIITLICIGLLISSCTPGGSTAVPASTFDITFNGKTYNLVSGSGNIIAVSTVSSTSPSSGITSWGVNVITENIHVRCNIGGLKFTDIGTSTGTYRGGCGSGTVYSILSVTDIDDGNKVYQSDYTGYDTTSTINVEISNTTECKGTFSIVLSNNGIYYPATGHFDYRH